MRVIKILIFFTSLVLFSCKENNEKKALSKHELFFLKTTTNDSISIVGDWKMSSYKDGENIFYLNVLMPVNFGYNHILQINNTEFCTWFLGNNLIRINYSGNPSTRTFKEDSLYAYVEKIVDRFQLILSDPNSKKQYILYKQ